MARQRSRRTTSAHSDAREQQFEAAPSNGAQSRYGNFFLADLLRQGRLPSGSAVPHRQEMEQSFGQDLSGVRATFGNSELAALGMNAVTSGEQVHFAEASPGRDVVGHEIAHVVQQRRFGGGAGNGVSRPGDTAERDAEKAGANAARGEPAQVGAAPTAQVHADWLSSIGDAIGSVGNAIGDALNLRENEAAWDLWEDYQDALEERREFEAATHQAEDFQSSTNIGMFDATYNPGTGVLTITVRCTFNFIDGSTADYPGSSAADVTWQDAAKTAWKTQWLTQCNATWSGNHTFYCQEDWWEDMTARVSVNFVESDQDPHYNLDITKIPPGEFARSSVGTGTPGSIFGLGRSAGHGTFDSEDLTPTNKPGGTQVGAVHEAGHMLGVDDEYGTGTPRHSGMVQDDLGHGVARGSDDRIMSGGMRVQPEHGVTFLAALREATDVSWAFAAKAPRPIPPDPSLANVGDFPTPDPNGPRYA